MKKIYIVGTNKLGGIKTYVNSLHESFDKINIQSEVIENKSKIIFQLLRYYFYKDKSKITWITWGIYNLLPINKDRHICIIHGHPSLNAQGIGKFIILSMSILYLRIFSKKSVSISNFTRMILKEFYLLNTKLITNSISYKYVKEEKIKVLKTDLSIRKFNFLLAGRLNSIKYPKYFLDLLKNYCVKNKLVVAAAGEFSKSNKFLLDKNFNYLGKFTNDELIDILLQSKVYLSLYSAEPFGLLHLEALWQGCVILGPVTGGFSEIANILNIKQILTFSSPKNFVEKLNIALDISKNLTNEDLVEVRKLIMLKFSPLEHAKQFLQYIYNS